jgi:hypothetical protein
MKATYVPYGSLIKKEPIARTTKIEYLTEFFMVLFFIIFFLYYNVSKY